MAAPTAAPPKKTPKKVAVKGVDPSAADGVTDDQVKEADEALEILEPLTDGKPWVIGKPPEKGGKETEYSVYTQLPLGYMARNRLFSLIGRTMSLAIKSTGGSVGGMEDVFGAGGGSLIDRGRKLGSRDWQDATQFFSLAMELIGYSPDFLSDFYAIVLDVPVGERGWFREVIEQPYRPDDDKWGLSEDDGVEMIERFIDQNYEDIRRFFVEKLPGVAKRAAQQERGQKKVQESA